MRALLLLLLTLPVAAQGAWIVRSDFQLHLTESLFDEIIADFWQSLQGAQEIPVADFSISPQGIPVHIRGIKARVDYSFPLPTRTEGRIREWELHSQNLSARLTVDSISANYVKVINDNGIIIRIPISAECHDIALKLPAGQTSVSARIRAEVENSQVKLSLPEYNAEWRAGAWEVESMRCSGIDGLDGMIKAEALKALSSFQNFDTEVRAGLEENFAAWSKEASLVLLNERELPSNNDYLKIFYQPRTATESGHGLLLGGELRFEYPFVSPDKTIEQYYPLEAAADSTAVNPQLMLPFGAVRSLMMGEYFAGKLTHSLWSREIPAFTEFMKSRWQQFWAWPELQKYPVNTQFAFEFSPMGPPSFDREKAVAGNAIQGDLNLPLSLRMYAPLENKYRPMVEFRTLVNGQAKLKLLKGGKIEMQLAAKENPVTYAWAKKYVQQYKPNQKVAADTIAAEVRKTLSREGFTMAMPALHVGKTLELVPEKWVLEGGKNLRLDFTTKK